MKPKRKLQKIHLKLELQKMRKVPVKSVKINGAQDDAKTKEVLAEEATRFHAAEQTLEGSRPTNLPVE